MARGVTSTLLLTDAVSSSVELTHPAAMIATANVATEKIDRFWSMGVSSLIEWWGSLMVAKTIPAKSADESLPCDHIDHGEHDRRMIATIVPPSSRLADAWIAPRTN